jgi:hypothetical protein
MIRACNLALQHLYLQIDKRIARSREMDTSKLEQEVDNIAELADRLESDL